MNLTDRLKQYNAWRRGSDDEPPNPTQLGNDIDEAIAKLAAADRLVPDLRVSACCYPSRMEADLTWESIETGDRFEMTVPITQDQIDSMIQVIGPCVYYNATQTRKEQDDE